MTNTFLFYSKSTGIYIIQPEFWINLMKLHDKAFDTKLCEIENRHYIKTESSSIYMNLF